MLINRGTVMGLPERRRLRAQCWRWGSRGLRVPVLGKDLISRGCGCFKGRRGRQDLGSEAGSDRRVGGAS